jgi:hypothetical protein
MGRDGLLFLLLGTSLVLLGSGCAIFMVAVTRSFGLVPSSLIILPASLLAIAAGMAAILAGRRGIAGAELAALAQALGIARRGSWRWVVGAGLLASGLALAAASCLALNGPWVPRGWPPELVDVGMLLFWLGTALAAIVALWLGLRLFRAPRPL